MKVAAVIVCAGQGRRLGKRDKGFLKLKGRPLFFYSLKVFKRAKEIKQIVLVFRKANLGLARSFISDKRITLAEGGRERKDSVYKGLMALHRDIDYVLVHDGARPFVDQKTISAILKGLKRHPAVVAGLKSTDTLKLTGGNYIRETLRRGNIFRAQTPQGFKKSLLLTAYKKFKLRKLTDDARAVELLGRKVRIIEGSRNNIKITYPEDIARANALLCGERSRGRRSASPTDMENYRIGLGFDVHRIAKARKALVLGGAKISSPFSLQAVSDGDVVLHAVSDAICGAAGLGDIGDYFPPGDKKSKGLDSKDIARFILKKTKPAYALKNLDVIIIADKPKLSGRKSLILKSLKKILGISAINLKIKSKEKLDILGGRNSMSCLALAALRKK